MVKNGLAVDPIAIFYGGWPRFEREQNHSQEYGRFVKETLDRAGYNTWLLDVSRERLFSFLGNPGNTVVYNALFGRFGEDGIIPGILELYGVSYTGCGPLASALTFDKFRCTRLMSAAGIKVPRSLLIRATGELLDGPSLSDHGAKAERFRSEGLGFSVLGSPVVVKPNRGSFGCGVALVHGVPDFAKALVEARRFDSEVIMQEFVDGYDVHVPVLCGRALEPAQSVPCRPAMVVGGHSFSTERRTYLIPSELTSDLIESVSRVAESAYTLAGCRGLCRTDLRITLAGEVVFFEINTQHSLRPTSIARSSAAAVGLSTVDVLLAVIEDRWVAGE